MCSFFNFWLIVMTGKIKKGWSLQGSIQPTVVMVTSLLTSLFLVELPSSLANWEIPLHTLLTTIGCQELEVRPSG